MTDEPQQPDTDELLRIAWRIARRIRQVVDQVKAADGPPNREQSDSIDLVAYHASKVQDYVVRYRELRQRREPGEDVGE